MREAAEVRAKVKNEGKRQQKPAYTSKQVSRRISSNMSESAELQGKHESKQSIYSRFTCAHCLAEWQSASR